ncbi:MAG TPA: NHL repeat-containing protein [Candidatus Cybelea sp.]|nr:NHL repeat-containing protein [Candidatus Cybelea sp.]
MAVLRIRLQSIVGFAVLALLAGGCGGPGVALQAVRPQPLSAARAPDGLSVLARARLYVLDSNLYSGTPSVTIFARGADGNATPLRTIAGTDTGMNTPGGIAVDGSGKIYVSDYFAASYGAVFVYAADASGDAPPIATITDGIADPSAVAVDEAGNVYVANFEAGSVTVYTAGTYALARTITGPRDISFSYCDGLTVDRSGKIYLLVGSYNGAPIKRNSSSYGGFIGVFPADANGPTMPLQLISGAKTRLTDPLGIAVDAQSRIYVTAPERRASRVLIFAANANGNVEPARELSGAQTELTGPNAIALDGRGSIFVTNTSYTGHPSVVAYPRGARGNRPPVRKLSGAKTQLQSITYVAVH